jgi:hypothetical protein
MPPRQTTPPTCVSPGGRHLRADTNPIQKRNSTTEGLYFHGLRAIAGFRDRNVTQPAVGGLQFRPTGTVASPRSTPAQHSIYLFIPSIGPRAGLLQPLPLWERRPCGSGALAAIDPSATFYLSIHPIHRPGGGTPATAVVVGAAPPPRFAERRMVGEAWCRMRCAYPACGCRFNVVVGWISRRRIHQKAAARLWIPAFAGMTTRNSGATFHASARGRPSYGPTAWAGSTNRRRFSASGT